MVRFKQKASRRSSGDEVVGRARGRPRQDPESGPASRRKRRLRPGKVPGVRWLCHDVWTMIIL
jgi:hypothetical protein